MLPSGWTTNRPGPTCVHPLRVRPSSRSSPPGTVPPAEDVVPCAPADAATASAVHRARPNVRERVIVADGPCVVVRMSEPILARRTERGVQTAFHHLRLDLAVLVRVDAVEDLLEQLAHACRVLA